MLHRILFLIATQILFGWSISSAQSFKGSWEGSSEGEVGTITFEKGGYVTFIIDHKTVGGKKFESSGVTLSMRYEFNDKVYPHTIDFIMSMIEGNMEVRRMLGIYEFINPTTLILNMDFEGGHRPEKFDPEDKAQISLKKVKVVNSEQ